MIMLYNSTQNKNEVVSAAQAIAQGISKDGGLFVPQEFPKYTEEDFKAFLALDYKGRAKKVFGDFLTDFTKEEIDDCVDNAYTSAKFGSDNPAPMAYTKLNGNELNILELWHGPTCAFKDMALQILPHFLTKSLKKTYDEMNTQEGNNVKVCAIKGNFDDAQTGVKKIFTTPEIADKLAQNNMLFSSANSINWGRLLPQIVYYISAYCDLVNEGKISYGDKINVVVPTGNFGNILASYYASLMGLPVNKFICASNSNNVLTDFINTGVYDKNRHFYTTISPSMDILVSSNLERLLYKLCGDSDTTTRDWMNALKSEGKYEVDPAVKAVIKDKFFGGCCDDEQTKATIKRLFDEDNYLCDTHTAVAVNVYEQYVEQTGDETPAVIASTASPYKFSKAVLEAVSPDSALPENEFDMVDKLNEITKTAVPAPLAGLKNKTARFSDVTEVDSMPQYVLGALNIE